MVFFLDGSPNNDIQDALREAERVRKVMREEESEKTVSRAESTEQTESGERVSAFARRGISRRSLSTGRARR